MLSFSFILSLVSLTKFVLGHNVIANTIFQFPAELGPSWLECVLPRDNGDLLLTTVTPSASIYTLSDPWSQNPKITSNTTLPGLNGTLGLVELDSNTFAVATARFELLFQLVAGSSELWTIKYKDGCDPEVCHLASIPEAGELNDLVLLNSNRPEQEILVVDSTVGLIWKVDTSTGNYSVWLDDPSMKHPDNATSRWPFGINGLRYARDGKSLYFSNTNKVSIYNIKLNDDGTPDGAPELVSVIPNVAALDDFAVDRHGRLWLTSNRDGKLVLLENKNGTWSSRIVLGGDTDHTIAGDTAVAFGRTKWDNTSLYLVTSGALGNPVPPDNFTESAKVVRIETRYMD